MEQAKPFFRIIDEICIEKNIKQKLLSYGWIRELSKENKIHYIINYQFDLNSEISFSIAGDKFATYEVLKSNNVPTIPHKIIFNPKTRSKYYKNKFIEDAKKMLIQSNYKLVIKANSSCKGKDVYYCSNEREIENIVKKLFEEKKDTLSACPYLDIDYEYRVIFLDNKILYVYKKRKAYVVGDNKKTIKELIREKEKLEKIKIDLCHDIDLNYIPKKGEEITVSWKHNLNSGAQPLLLDEKDEFLDEVKKVAIKAGNALNIKFASIDVAVTKDKKVLVMEVNGSVCMNKFSEVVPNGYEIAKEIYLKAIDKMFE